MKKENGTNVPTGRDNTYDKTEVRRKSIEELFGTVFNSDQQRVLNELFSGSGGGGGGGDDEEQTSPLDEEAFGGKTYREIFNNANVAPLGNFENGLAWVTTNTGNAAITEEAHVSGTHSLKCFGTSSVQINVKPSFSSAAQAFVACKVRVDRWVKGGGAGISFYGGSGNSVNFAVKAVTDDFVTKGGYVNIPAGTSPNCYFGTFSSANADCYIDDACIINMSKIWSDPADYPTADEMLALYDEWVTMVDPPIVYKDKKIFVGAILSAVSESARFTAMKELLDCASKISADPKSADSVAIYSATKGCVVELPANPAMFQNIPLDALYTLDGDSQTVPASTTKVMTAITGLDYVNDLNEKVTIKSSDIETGSGNVFTAGDIVSIKDLLYAMMLPSSNTGAHAFARACGEKIVTLNGGTPTDTSAYNAFISAMTAKASVLGMTNSVFIKASGGTVDNKMTARDAVRMTIEACSYPELMKIWGKRSYVIAVGGTNPRSVTINTTVTDAALEQKYTILGGKTGSWNSTYYALVMVAMQK